MSTIRRNSPRGSGTEDAKPASAGGRGHASDSQLVKLRILDKEVQLACQSGEEDELMQAAAYVNRAMRELRQRNATSSIEKIAIVTAINTASSLLQARARAGDDAGAESANPIDEKRTKSMASADKVAGDTSASDPNDDDDVLTRIARMKDTLDKALTDSADKSS